MIKRHGIERIAFHTLTFAENIWDREEAQRRFNSYATNFLRKECIEFIAAVERQKRGAIHYHCILALPFDVRTGFDFEAASAAGRAKRAGNVSELRRLQGIYSASANGNLRSFWERVGNSKHRGAAQGCGFGRCETLPVLSNAEAVSRYVGAYVTSEWRGRQWFDKGLRTIRYSLEERKASCRWTWVSGPALEFRRGCRVLSAILRTEDFCGVLGKRWAFNWRKEVAALGRHWEKVLAWVESNLSDNDTTEDRIACASEMAAVIFSHEGTT